MVSVPGLEPGGRQFESDHPYFLEEYPSGQRKQTVNLSSIWASKVRILSLPPFKMRNLEDNMSEVEAAEKISEGSRTPLEKELVAAICKMNYLKKCLPQDVEVYVFRDGGCGSFGTKINYSIVIGDSWQVSFGELSRECFDRLLKDGYIQKNSLRTWKNRSIHRFVSPTCWIDYAWKYAPLSETIKHNIQGYNHNNDYGS